MIYGRDYEAYSWLNDPDPPKCGCCGKETTEPLTPMPTWDFDACPTCAAECLEVEAQETLELKDSQ